jgi:transposase
MLTLRCSSFIKKLQDLDQNLEVELWAMDEVRFQQHGSSCRMWVPPETRNPVILHHPTHRSVGYFGAVRLSDGKFVFQREETRFNAQTFLGFLQNLRLDSGETGRRVMVITDNARYHHAKMHQGWRAQQDQSFALDFLPPYSPELNPIERVWRLVRRRCIHNKYFPRLEDVMQTVEDQFFQWASGSEALVRLCAIK